MHRCYSGRYKLQGDQRVTQVSLEITDKCVAEKRLAEIVNQEQRRKSGLDVASYEGSNSRIETALQWFCEDLCTRGREKIH